MTWKNLQATDEELAMMKENTNFFKTLASNFYTMNVKIDPCALGSSFLTSEHSVMKYFYKGKSRTFLVYGGDVASGAISVSYISGWERWMSEKSKPSIAHTSGMNSSCSCFKVLKENV